MSSSSSHLLLQLITSFLAFYTLYLKYFFSRSELLYSLHQVNKVYSGKSDTPVTNIYLCKVPESASSTLHNILTRFGVPRNLSFMVFANRAPYLNADYRPYLSADPTRPGFNGYYNFFIEHSRFNKQLILQRMPADTVFIGSIRDPLLRMRGLLYSHPHPSNKTVEEFLRGVNVENHIAGKYVEVMSKYYAYNGDQKYLQYLLDTFKVVVVVEMMSESMVMLKRKLCWTMKDIVIFKTGLRHGKYNHSDDLHSQLPTELLEKHHQWTPRDYELYTAFKQKLLQQIEEEEKRGFYEEVEHYKTITSTTGDFCSGICSHLQRFPRQMLTDGDEDVIEVLEHKVNFGNNEWGNGFNISGYDCLRMMWGPDIYRQAIKFMQNPELCNQKINESEKIYCSGRYVMDNIPWEIFGLSKYRVFRTPCL